MKTTCVLTAAVLLAGVGVSVAAADVVFYSDQVAFESAMPTQGLTLQGLETFEEHNLPDSTTSYGLGPVSGGVPWSGSAGGFPTGLDLLSLSLDSAAAGQMQLISTGYNAAVSSMLGAQVGSDKTYLLFSGGQTFGVGLNIRDLYIGGATATIDVYDTNDVLLGTGTTSCPLPYGFFGVGSDVPIGRLRVATMTTEMVDNVQTWVPEPGTLALLAFGAVAALRRR